MTRALKFFAAFFGTAVIIFLAIFLLNRNAFLTFFDNREAMAEGSEWVEETYSLRGLTHYIGQNPDNVSVASRVAASPDSSIFFMEHLERPMGTTGNFFTMLAVAELAESGEIPLTRTIPWEEISEHQLPGVNRSEHQQSYETAVERGWIENGEISLDHVMQLLGEFNDLALADYAWWLVGPDRWADFEQSLSLQSTSMPLPFSGLYLTISPGIRGLEAAEIYDRESVKENREFRESVITRASRFLDESSYRKETLQYLNDNRLGNTFIEERNGLMLFPKTTAAEMTGLLQKLVDEELLSAGVSQQVKEWMRWPMQRQSGIERDFSDYGAIYDNRMGLLNGIDFGTSAYTGDTTVQAVFFDRVQIAFWFHMSSNHMHQDFQQRLMFDPAMIEQMTRVADQYSPEQAANQP